MISSDLPFASYVDIQLDEAGGQTSWPAQCGDRERGRIQTLSNVLDVESITVIECQSEQATSESNYLARLP